MAICGYLDISRVLFLFSFQWLKPVFCYNNKNLFGLEQNKTPNWNQFEKERASFVKGEKLSPSLFGKDVVKIP